jgi:hypothetical protein
MIFKESRPAEHVDKVLADFIGCVIDKPSHCRREITVWRGEYDNAHGIAMSSIGLPKRLPQCKPYLLLAQGRVWQFDARRPPFSEGSLTLAGRVLPVCYLPYIALRKRKKKDSQGGYHYRRCLAETGTF